MTTYPHKHIIYTTLFLDRDGVINHRLPGRYVQHPDEFRFLDQVPEAIKILGSLFDRIIVVTNQQGINKGLMTSQDLELVHEHLQKGLEAAGGRIDTFLYCPELATTKPLCRKPNPGMAFQAREIYPEIDFAKSIMVGDSMSDMLFGKRMGMKTIMIRTNPDEYKKASLLSVDQSFESLYAFAAELAELAELG